MATALQLAANRRNAQKSTGPRTAAGKAAVRLNAVKHGMTAKSVLIPHESADDYNEIRAALIADYAPATSQELMLVDQIAAGYWRTIRARRVEVKTFDSQLRLHKHKFGKSEAPNNRDDEGCAVILQTIPEDTFKNYFRYDASISRDYYRAIAALEKMQAARRREEHRHERDACEEAEPDIPTTRHVTNTRVMSSGFVSCGAPAQQGGGRPRPPADTLVGSAPDPLKLKQTGCGTALDTPRNPA